MFDIGFGEMLLVGAIALIAIGPKQLPEVARTAGRILGELRKVSSDFTRTLMEARDSTSDVLGDAQRQFTETHQQLMDRINEPIEHLNSQLSFDPHAPAEHQHSFPLDQGLPPHAATDEDGQLRFDMASAPTQETSGSTPNPIQNPSQTSSNDERKDS